MQEKTKNRKEKNEVTVRDLKPKKDAKGGLNYAGSSGPGRQGSPTRMPTCVE